MNSPGVMRAELDAQRCLIEQQHIEIRRLQRRIDVVLRHTAQLQDELDAINAPRHPPAPQPAQGSPNHGNGHRAARHFKSATNSSSVEQTASAGDRRRASASRIAGRGRSRKA
jgi:hypothetical protein